MENFSDFIEEASAHFIDFQQYAEKANNGNKSAGIRARKASLELEKMLKEYRKVSLEMAKK